MMTGMAGRVMAGRVLALRACLRTACSQSDPGPPKTTRSETTKKTRVALESKNRKAKKWLGQHYMVDDAVTRASVDAASIQAGDVVLEVGPGTGVLTEELLRKGAQVVAVDKDKDMVELTRERLLPSERLEVLHHDIMKWPLEEHVGALLARTGAPGGTRAKIVANLPYNITTEFLQRILPRGDLFSTAVLMLQDDAAKRLVASKPGSPDYRKMNVLVNFYSNTHYALFVDRQKYFPPPKFHGAVVRFDLKSPEEYPRVHSTQAFLQLVERSFSLKRKMLRSSLASRHSADAVEKALQGIGLPVTCRPEDLSLQQFIALTNALDDTQPKPQTVQT